MFENEIWEDLVGYEGLYIISNFGRIKILPKIHINKSGCIISKEKFVKIYNRNQGYVGLSLSKNKNRINKYLHRLLADTFIPNPENKPHVNHKNGVKNDNRLENLEWVSAKENIQHSFNIGLSKRGENRHLSKLKNNQVLDIKDRLKNKEKQNNIAKIYRVSNATITNIKNGKIWYHI